LNSLLEPLFRSGFIFWLEILHIGTLRARYRAEHRNRASATVFTIDDGGEAQVAYESGDAEDLTKKDLQDLLGAYGKECLKKYLTESCLLSITLKIS
jgi:hypothetical protein